MDNLFNHPIRVTYVRCKESQKTLLAVQSLHNTKKQPAIRKIPSLRNHHLTERRDAIL